MMMIISISWMYIYLYEKGSVGFFTLSKGSIAQKRLRAPEVSTVTQMSQLPFIFHKLRNRKRQIEVPVILYSCLKLNEVLLFRFFETVSLVPTRTPVHFYFICIQRCKVSEGLLSAHNLLLLPYVHILLH